MKLNDFDKIAFIYDRLAKLVFGRSIIDSQKYFLGKIPSASRVLILGGGSGWILQELLAVTPDVKICYIEASAKMITSAKEKSNNDHRVQFIRGTEDNIPHSEFDVVIMSFYFDLFSESSLKSVLQKVRPSSTPNPIWIVTDFVNKKWWHNAMLKLMYAFFKAVSNIEANKLPNWNNAIRSLGGKKTESKSFYGNFIEAAVYQF